MSGSPWLARLKNERVPETAPTEPTKPGNGGSDGGFVGFVGPESGAVAKTLATASLGFVGFAGADSGAQSDLPGSTDSGDSEFSEQFAHARAERSTPIKEWPNRQDDAHAARVERLMARGMSLDRADALAERLAIRDSDADDRRMCIECSHYGARGRCIAAATGRLIGAAKDLQPVPDVLQRCEAFGLRKGLQ